MMSLVVESGEWGVVKSTMVVEDPKQTVAWEASAWKSWLVSAASLSMVALQSACTIVMAVSGYRVLIGLSALAAASGLNRPSSGFHADTIRVPMLLVAVAGSLLNLYVIWRVRSLRARPAAQWRTQPVTRRKRWSENLQIVLAVLTLLLVIAEEWTHLIVHNA